MPYESYLNYVGRIHTTDSEFIVNNNCISCGICSDVCPAKNITLEAGRYFTINAKAAWLVSSTVQRGHSIIKTRLKTAGGIHILKWDIKRLLVIISNK